MRNQQPPCPNLNHWRRVVTIQFCLDCGSELSTHLTVSPCREADHAQRRRRQATYCTDCGLRLCQ